ncbi:10009_t:CDS:1, partial [Acaulospora morrowiae]
PIGTIGIVVIPTDNRYTQGARKYVRTSKYKILLTNIDDLCTDLIDFVARMEVFQFSKD